MKKKIRNLGVARLSGGLRYTMISVRDNPAPDQYVVDERTGSYTIHREDLGKNLEFTYEVLSGPVVPMVRMERRRPKRKTFSVARGAKKVVR